MDGLTLLFECERVMRDAVRLVQSSEDLMARSQRLMREGVAVRDELLSTLTALRDSDSIQPHP